MYTCRGIHFFYDCTLNPCNPCVYGILTISASNLGLDATFNTCGRVFDRIRQLDAYNKISYQNVIYMNLSVAFFAPFFLQHFEKENIRDQDWRQTTALYCGSLFLQIRR